MFLVYRDFFVYREHYKDLLREAERNTAPALRAANHSR